VPSKTFTVVAQFEPDEERQVAAILMVLRKATQKRDLEDLDMPSEVCRPQLVAGDGIENQRRCHGAVSERSDNDTSATDITSSD
jgi:hypothetical protein